MDLDSGGGVLDLGERKSGIEGRGGRSLMGWGEVEKRNGSRS